MNIQEMGDQIKVTIPKNREDTIPLKFTVNGESVTVPRGEEVTIPAMFAGAIKNWWKSQFYEKGEDDASLKGEGGLTPFFLNIDTFDTTSAEAGDKVIQAILNCRTIYVYSDNMNNSLDAFDLHPVTFFSLPKYGGTNAWLSYSFGDNQTINFKTSPMEGDNPYVKEFNV